MVISIAEFVTTLSLDKNEEHWYYQGVRKYILSPFCGIKINSHLTLLSVIHS